MLKSSVKLEYHFQGISFVSCRGSYAISRLQKVWRMETALELFFFHEWKEAPNPFRKQIISSRVRVRFTLTWNRRKNQRISGFQVFLYLLLKESQCLNLEQIGTTELLTASKLNYLNMTQRGKSTIFCPLAEASWPA